MNQSIGNLAASTMVRTMEDALSKGVLVVGILDGGGKLKKGTNHWQANDAQNEKKKKNVESLEPFFKI